jgi:hypothetical protein
MESFTPTTTCPAYAAWSPPSPFQHAISFQIPKRCESPISFATASTAPPKPSPNPWSLRDKPQFEGHSVYGTEEEYYLGLTAETAVGLYDVLFDDECLTPAPFKTSHSIPPATYLSSLPKPHIGSRKCTDSLFCFSSESYKSELSSDEDGYSTDSSTGSSVDFLIDSHCSFDAAGPSREPFAPALWPNSGLQIEDDSSYFRRGSAGLGLSILCKPSEICVEEGREGIALSFDFVF